MAKPTTGRKPPPTAAQQKAAKKKAEAEAKKKAEAEAAKNGGDTTTPPTRGNAAHAGQPAHLRKASVMRRLAGRVKLTVHGKEAEGEGRGSTEMDGWIDDADLNAAKAHADQAYTLLCTAAQLLEDKGTDFKPTADKARGARSRKLTKGTIVRMREKQRSSYEDLLTTAEMDNLTVQDHRGSKIVLLTPDGGRLFLPRGHIELKDDDEAAAA